MYNGYILTTPPRIIDDVEEREIEKKGMSSLSNNLSHHIFIVIS
jgi:hypothetical protein